MGQDRARRRGQSTSEIICDQFQRRARGRLVYIREPQLTRELAGLGGGELSRLFPVRTIIDDGTETRFVRVADILFRHLRGDRQTIDQRTYIQSHDDPAHSDETELLMTDR